MKRVASVAGSFYPATCNKIEEFIDKFNHILDLHNIKIEQFKAKAIISPHAGYIYSGFTANMAYRSIDKNSIKRVVVVGPSHRVYLKGASVSLQEVYETPCGNLKIDKSYAKKLIDNFNYLTFMDEAHHEHSTETQIPFIKHYLGDVEVVEIVYGDINYKDLEKVIEYILKDEDNFVVISTDLSHFYNLQKANSLDSICIKAVVSKDLNAFYGCEACGIIGVKAITKYAKEHNLDIKLLDYRTSYDATNDKSSVVGYSSFIIY